MRRIAFRFGIAFVALAIFVVGAFAQPTSFAKQRVKIRAGILLLDSTVGPGLQPTNADPYVFYNLDRREDVKPAGWEFENPLASTSITDTILTRWAAIYAQLGVGGTAYTAAEKLGKNMAPYWEIRLSQINAEQLTDFDILMIHAPGNINLNSSEREKLRYFMDKGGILWFDKAAFQTVDPFNSFPIPFRTTAAGINPQVVSPRHPILNYPFQLGYLEAAYMGLHRGTHAILRGTLASVGLGAGWDELISTMDPDFDKFTPIINNTAGMVMGVAEVGNGFFVVTAGNLTSYINEPAGGTNLGGVGRNSGPIGGTNFNAIPATELKFVYNMIALAGGHSSLSKGSRRLNTTFDDLGAPLLETWNDGPIALNHGDETNYIPPAIYKGLVIVSVDGRLRAYKTDLSRDLDGDGNFDDGFQDTSLGASVDLVWESSAMTAPLSSPVCYEISNPGAGVPRDQVAVLDGAGRLNVFNVFPTTPQGRIAATSPVVQTITVPGPAPVVDTSLDARGPYTPVYFEGQLFVYDTYQGVGTRNGRVWVVNPATLSIQQSFGNPWTALGNGAPNLPEPGGSPTAGYIPISDGSGGMDKVMYVASRSTLSGGPAGISSIWLGAKGESPTLENPTPATITLSTRVASKPPLRIYMPGGQDSLGVRVYLVDSNGNPYNAAQTATYLTGTVTQVVAGKLIVGLTGTPLPAGSGFRVDYTIDLGDTSPAKLAGLIRGQLFFPDDINRRRYMQKSMALAPSGNLMVVTSNEFNNGSLFCIKEFARGQFNLVYRWDLHDGYTVTINNNQNVRIPSAIEDRDDLWTFFGFGYPTVRRLHFHGSPTIRGDVAYLTISCDQQLGFFPVRSTYLAAFDANPKRIDIRLGQPIPSGLRIRQPDIAASTNKAFPDRFVSLQNAMADQETNTGVIRFLNGMSTNSGQMQNGFSMSMPVIVSANNQVETILYPDGTGSRWNPMLWYMGISGFVCDSPPMVMGNTLYMAGATILADLFSGSFPPVPRGSMFAMDAEIPTNDPSIISIPSNPGLRQVRWIIAGGPPPGFTSNPHIRWPSGQGVQNFGDFILRVRQTVVGNGSDTLVRGVVGGDGTLAAWTDNFVYGFRKATTLIADEGRILEVDSAGFARWASDVSYQSARDNVTQFKVSKLVRPTRAYKITESEFAVVDTGGSRIALIDRSAGELRTIEKLTLDTTYRPGGWSEGDPADLRQPRDVQVWGDYVPAANNPLSSPNAMEFWVHYLIADSGNRRLIELVDRYIADPTSFTVGDAVRDSNGLPIQNVLYWHTPRAFTGKTWQYTGIQRFQIGVSGGNAQFAYIGAVGDMMPTRVSTGLDVPSSNADRETGGGNGGIVIFDPVSGDQVINEIVIPAVGAAVGSYPAGPAKLKRLTGVNSVSVRRVSTAPGYAIMITDSTGVYEVVQNGATWNVVWMLPNEVYYAIRNVNFRAVSAKRLINGQVLITNSYNGINAFGTNFYGEVTQWVGNTFDPNVLNMGFASTSVKLELPPIVGTKGLRNPQFADRL